MNLFRLSSILLLAVLIASCSKKEKNILVLSKTAGFRHSSIETGIAAIKKLGFENGFNVVSTEDASYFVEDSLKNFDAVVFLNTTGNILDAVQQADFERFIQAGGGFVGVHAATDTEYGWPWYNKLVGAYFKNHPKIQTANLRILDNTHMTTKMLESTWAKADEWYNFRNIYENINVLIDIDESSYEGGENGEQHPISWYHEYDGGRSFYTAMGHTEDTYQDKLFLDHLLAGINYAAGNGTLNYQVAKSDRVPPENRFVKQVLDFNLDEPMELDELPGQGLLFIERRGNLKLYDFKSSSTKVIDKLDLFYGNEDGLIGLAVDPNYLENNWIYLFYSAADKNEQHISRFTLKNGVLDKNSEKILIQIPVIRKCCHSGGSLEFGPDGNLFIAVGDNTNPFESQGYAPIDEREGRALWDAQKSAANTNDFRGKILRIKPEDDGTYSIPEGNLFPNGTPNTRPEIYVMGCRNPFRFSIDRQNGYVYWGDVGPDAGKNDPERGPKGMGEFNQARKAGFWGWPYTRGNNQQYRDYDFASNTSGAPFDVENIINDSPNNTGIKNLPPVQPSFVWYSYDRSEEFPWLGEGGVNPMAGPVFHASNFANTNESAFPAYFENKLFVYEWMRDWVYVVSFDENHNYIKSEPFMPNTEFSHPMDMIFGADGNLYTLEYGQKWNAKNLDARLSKVSYISGNRNPIAKITTDKEIGAVPLNVSFSGASSLDYDGDKLNFEWSFTNKSEVQSTTQNPSFTFTEAGAYDVQLKVTDAHGNTSTANTKILAGNEPPQLTIQIDPADSFYADNKKVSYKVLVTDNEDGDTESGSIDKDKVKVTFSYIPEGEDIIKATIGHQQNVIPEGKILIDETDCKACHAINEKVNGPSYMEIAQKYDKQDRGYLINRVSKGGSGVWGESLMSAHPQLALEDIGKIIDYILLLDPNKKLKEQLLPINGTVEFKEHLKGPKAGKYILIASYLDKGNDKVQNSSLSANAKVVFMPQTRQAENADIKSEGLSDWNAGGAKLVGSIRHDSFLGFKNINLKGLKSISFAAYYAPDYRYEGTLEIREGSSTGPVIGKVDLGYYSDDKEKLQDYSIPVSPTSKSYEDIFLVFKNPSDHERYVANANWVIMQY